MQNNQPNKYDHIQFQLENNPTPTGPSNTDNIFSGKPEGQLLRIRSFSFYDIPLSYDNIKHHKEYHGLDYNKYPAINFLISHVNL